MPNLKPPITTTAAAMAYCQSILKALPEYSDFTPLMTLYLTDTTSPNEIKLARDSGVVFVVKLYPAGATTNSQDGVTDLFGKCLPVLEEMVQQIMPLLVHGEVTIPDVDMFDREEVFIDTVLSPLVQKIPQLKVIMEHITTMDAVNFVESCDKGFVAPTVTPQHLILNRNSLFQGGLQPHNYCLLVLKREIHRRTIVSAVTSGSKRFFLELIALLMIEEKRSVLVDVLESTTRMWPCQCMLRFLKRPDLEKLEALRASMDQTSMAFLEIHQR
ncbi:hypothetical protein DH2020_023588 [Rehmannia glutinosa]|uniref:Dihydroorotase n=1 Tax=Rehmannia glutinosa TaxID=99300 RepID=A0ABR0W7W8_REHGL